MKVVVRLLAAEDVPEADRIMRLAFGTSKGLADPLSFMGDGSSVRPRWQAYPRSAFGVEVDGRLAGSNFITQWGSFLFFGPLSIDPAFWGCRLVHHLMEPVMARLQEPSMTHAGLFTHSHSVKHIGLYQKYGFRPRMLTAMFEKPITPQPCQQVTWHVFRDLDDQTRPKILKQCRRMTRSIYDGLDVTGEINFLFQSGLGDTVLTKDDKGDLSGLAICHYGAGSEGGSDNCYVKFAAAAPGGKAQDRFIQLLHAVTDYASRTGAGRVIAGVNSARQEAYETMLAQGFDMLSTGIAMHRPNDAGFCRPGVYVIDDWR
jgi:hypothetical protein